VYRKTLGIAAWIIFILSGFFLILLLLLNYYYNCSLSTCSIVKPLLSRVYWFDKNVLAGFIESLPGSYTGSLFWQSTSFFVLFLLSFFLIRVARGIGRALWEMMTLGFSTIVLFGIGILLLDPTWWTKRISNYVPFPFNEITNAELTIVSVIGFLTLLFVKRFYRSKA